MKQLAVAIELFNKVLKMCEGLGEEGSSLIKSADILPQIYLRYGKELASKRDIDQAIIQIKSGRACKANSRKMLPQRQDLLPMPTWLMQTLISIEQIC